MTDLTITPAPVRKTVLVQAPPARAFEVFTARMGRWWAPSHSIAPSGLADVVVEPRPGGRWYEVGKQGEQCDWGHVRVWEPPTRLVLVWSLSAEWRHDPAIVTEVEVTFTAEGAATRVVLEHRGLDAYGAAADAMRTTFASDGGWGGLLAGFVAAT